MASSGTEPVGFIIAGIVFIAAGVYESSIPYVGIIILVGIALFAIGLYELIARR
ncbi:MAG TPA: hypothetical protein VMV00_03175 [Candidatus Baltobacteraceae bacterium]|nr:hypothetical protein [Candidatus Baltobacteraceae bacterium]